MKRRHFVLSASALATISLTISGAMASFADSASAVANFQTVVPMDTETKLDLAPNTTNRAATHTWEFGYLFIDSEVETITVDYPAGANFNGLDDTNITVEIDRTGDGETSDIDVNQPDTDDETYSGSTATFELNGSYNTNIEGLARVTIDGIENPAAGEYTPSMTFTTPVETETLDAEMTITDNASYFEPSITNVPVSVDAGEQIIADYTVTNTGVDTEEKTVTASVASAEASTAVELAPEESYSDSISYTTTTDDVPSVGVDVETPDEAVSETVSVGNAFGLDLDPTTAGATDATHTWTAGNVDFTGEIDTITIDYGSSGASLDGIRTDRNGGDLDQDVVVKLTRELSSGPSKDVIGLNNGDSPYSGSTATVDLSGYFTTNVAGEIEVIVGYNDVGVENPGTPGSYSADIILEGDQDTFTDTVSFTVD